MTKTKKEKKLAVVTENVVNTPKENGVKAEVKKAVKSSTIGVKVQEGQKIGHYSIIDPTRHFSISRLMAGSGKRHFILLCLLNIPIADVTKEGLVLRVSDLLKGKESLADKVEIASGLTSKYNAFFKANNILLRVSAKRLLKDNGYGMTKELTLFKIDAPENIPE